MSCSVREQTSSSIQAGFLAFGSQPDCAFSPPKNGNGILQQASQLQ